MVARNPILITFWFDIIVGIYLRQGGRDEDGKNVRGRMRRSRKSVEKWGRERRKGLWQTE